MITVKVNNRIAFFRDVLFSWGLNVLGVGVFASGFQLDVSMEAVAVCCLVTALWACTANRRQTEKWVWIPLAVAVTGLALSGALLPSLQSLADQVLAPGISTDCTLALSAVACILCAVSARGITGEHSLRYGMWVLLGPVLCIYFPRAVPGSLWLFGFLGLFSLFLLTQGLRCKAPDQGNRLLSIALIPVLCTTLFLYFAIPRESYRMDQVSLSWMQQIRSWLLSETSEAPTGDPLKVGGGAVTLSSLGDRRESNRTVLTVTSETGGAMYLRSCSYDTYYSNYWTNLAVPDSLSWPETDLLTPVGQVEIQTHGYLDMVLTPYYPTDGTLTGVTRGISNYTDKRNYSYPVGILPENLPETAMPENLSAYTQLPAQTKAWGNAILQTVLDPSGSVKEKAEAIADFVSQSAEYTLTPGKMPPVDTDFVRWFLEDNKKGYCVHFASAGTVLLRAAGIPARYVTGYLFTALENEPTEVTGNQAHAWVEYWLPGVGWQVLETTPAAAVSRQLALPEEEIPVTEPVESPEEVSGFSIPVPPLWTVFVFFGVVTVCGLLRWPVAIALKNRRCRKGSTNARALAWWKRLTQISGKLGIHPEEAVEMIAQKAAFSPHTLTEPEVLAVKDAFCSAVAQARSRSLPRRIYWRLFLTLY